MARRKTDTTKLTYGSYPVKNVFERMDETMKRSELEALGLNKEQVDAVIKINGDDIENAKKTAESETQNVQKEVDSLKSQVKERDKQLETLKATAGDNEALTKQIADLQAENATAKETHETEMTRLKVDFAVEKALAGANAKNVKAVRALLDLEDAKLDKEGNVKGLREQIDKLTAADDTKFLFEVPEPNQGQQKFKGFQPGTPAENKPGEGVDTSKMNYDELCAYLEANPDATLE